MNGTEMLRLLDAISRDRNVEKEVLIVDLEQAMESAARKHFNAVDTEEFTCEIDRFTGKIGLWRGEEPIELEELGRIPAQTAKQVMIQRFREDERNAIYDEYIDRVGELTTGIAQRYEGGSLVVQIGRAEGFMPRSEQIPGEQHQPGERVRCLILDVRDAGNQVKIVLSRASPELIRRLFEVEVPEVAERIIEIKAMAREAGHRTKIAVQSIDSKVDAVGACVGVRGSRIKNIVDEMGGEKIDIVRWNESSQILIQNALKPAEVVEISLCFELGRATVVVDEDQLSLAIGKRGQNVRLAARLTMWDVDILTPQEYTKSMDIMETTLRELEFVTDEMTDKLAALGVISVFDVEEVGREFLMETMELDEESLDQLLEVVSAKAKVVAEEQAKEKAEQEKRKREQMELAAQGIDDLLGGAAAGDGAGGGALDDLLGGGASSDDAADSGEGDDASDEAEHRAYGEPGEDLVPADQVAQADADDSASADAGERAEQSDDEDGSEFVAEHTDSDAGVVGDPQDNKPA
ncbi:MAG: transcription termination factor NusA [Phycisphaerales bacterium JB063]